jgi:hypothetical protein
MAKKPRRDAQDKRIDETDGKQPIAAESANELRELAIVFEVAATEGLAGLADLDFPLSTGDLKEFPRPAADLRAAEQGLEYLRESAERVSAMLAALAAAREQGLEVPPTLRAIVEPFVATLRARR